MLSSAAGPFSVRPTPVIIHKKGGKGGRRSRQASPPLLFQPLLAVVAAADVAPACPAGAGKEGGPVS